MSNLIIATLTIEGIRPLLWNVFSAAILPPSGRPKRGGTAGNDPEEWKRTVRATPEGQLYLEPRYFFACFRDGAKFTKKGLHLTVSATLQVLDEIILTNRFLPNAMNDLPTDPTAPVYLDIRPVFNVKTRSRNIRYRVAAAPGWQMTFHLLWDESLVSRTLMQAVANDAGYLAGLGDARQLGFGRFNVLTFEVRDATSTSGTIDLG